MSDNTPAPAAQKRLPFKPTALRKAALPANVSTHGKPETDDVDGLELFRRAKEMQPLVEADRERKMRRRQKQEEERRKAAETAVKRSLEPGAEPDITLIEDLGSTVTVGSRTPVAVTTETTIEMITPPASKRARLDSSPMSGSKLSFDSAPGDRAPTRLTSPPPGTIVAARSPPIIDIIDSDDDVVVASDQSPDLEVLDELSAGVEDDEFADYVRQAEEMRAQDPADKATTEIVITSSTPGCKSCCIKYHFNKALQRVRDTWLALQKRREVFGDDVGGDDIVLTLRRQKIYPSTRLLNLGIRPQGNGKIIADGGAGCLLRDRTQVHLEAWTLADFEAMQRRLEARRRRSAYGDDENDGSSSGDDDDDDEDDGSEARKQRQAKQATPQPDIKLRVILKARDYEDVKLTVRPETTVETLITGFRAERSIAPSMNVGVWFDGERLAEHVTMDEAEIDDMDTFEVHIK